ncbi:translation initiation factor IF-2 [Deminuibacter soli]|uniref:Translation initiation factor IF-2 n=1 Tax=Deminuibacter soli TaxID=2291815 RepID=A0A3E1NQ18_9BACT|nr:translation initiation factor IF-2 [Deminuibacter soli]RFM29997.1 translation initiation factor IF-2 [Deminuibacter soli]
MSELKLPRVLAAAKEFNVGQDTLVEFLVGKGFNRDDLKSTAKLSEPMYRALQQEFQGDKVAKNKADLIEIPKGMQGEKRKKEEEEQVFRKDEKKVVVKEEKTEKAEQPAEEQAPPSPVKETPPPPPVVAEEPKPVAQQPVTPVAPVAQEPVAQPEPKPVQVEAEKEPAIVKVQAPEIAGPKILDKIDLSAIDSSTRPKKVEKRTEEEEKPVVKKEEAPAAPVQETKPAPVAEKPVVAEQPQQVQQTPPVAEKQEAPKQQPQQPVATPQVQREQPPVTAPTVHAPVANTTAPTADAAEHDEVRIENIKAEKIEGPKILGKIELPVDNDTRPKVAPRDRDEKRKRKRIPIDKKGDNTQQHQGGGGNQQRPGGQQGGGNFNRGGGAPGQNRPGGGQHQGGHGGPGQHGGHQGQGGQGGFNRGGNNSTNRSGQGNNRPGNANRPNRPTVTKPGERREEKEINQKEIQEKIRQTQAKLAGASGRGKSLKAKYRRAKREEAAEAMGEGNDDNKLQVTEFVTVSELANLMDVSFAEVISKCMSLGIMVSINQRLDAEVIELVAGEFGYEVEFMGLDDVEEDDVEEEDSEENQLPRAPVVTIMGHVDHGKTSLLDYIRSANVVAGEAGGITQHIGAYQVTTANEKKITFLDTPGHEAFTAMRARGAKAADVAVIVVAADDAVMPQTKEAISHAQAAQLPMIFAINKIDKDGANAQKIYEQLSQMNILVEEWGGKYQSQQLSAKQGLNVDLLLEKIALESELLNLKANPNREASGTIIEASLDKGRGYVATVLVQNGTLKQGDLMVSGQYFGRIKAMFNERNQRVDEVAPSTPVQILGLNGAPQAGEKFKVFTDESEAKEIANKRAQILREQGLRARKHITLDEIGRRLALGNFKELNIIIKGDVDGSVEALSDSLQKLSTEEIAVRVVHKAVGQISESDVLLATASDAIVIGFNVRPSMQANRLAETEGVQIKLYSIIYQAIEEVKSAMEGMLEPKIQEKIVANVEVREVYKFDKATVAGCYVLDGKIARNNKIRIIRDGIVEYPKGEGQHAELGSLKRFKDDMKEVAAGYECGLTIKNFNDLKVGDVVEAFEEEEVKRTL